MSFATKLWKTGTVRSKTSSSPAGTISSTTSQTGPSSKGDRDSSLVACTTVVASEKGRDCAGLVLIPSLLRLVPAPTTAQFIRLHASVGKVSKLLRNLEGGS